RRLRDDIEMTLVIGMGGIVHYPLEVSGLGGSMFGTAWLVIVAGLAAIGWVNWYFFFAGRSAAPAQANGAGMAEVRIAVRGGYEPATARVKAGAPVRLVFDRQETSGCSDEV